MERRLQLGSARALLLCLLIISLVIPGPMVYAKEGKEREVIRVGFFAFEGYHMIDEEGNRSGYGYDFLRLASRYIDVDYEYVGYDKSWEEMLEMLENGEIDMVTSAQDTPERMKTFAVTKPVGTSSAILTVKSDNTDIVAYDYQTYEGIRVGMIKGSTRNEDFALYAKENGFTYQPVYYSLSSELTRALQTGEVDAAVTSSLRKTEKERVMDTFDTEPFYVMVRKSDQDLLDKMNYAIDQMNATEGDWKNNLLNQYYTREEDKNLEFTEQEEELIRQYASGEKTLVVSASTDREPYSYVENGKLKGIIPDYFQRLADYLGISYRVIIPSSREEYQRWQKEAKADLFLDARSSFAQWCEEASFSITAPYTTMRLVMVTRRNFDGDVGVLAVAESQGAFGIEEDLVKDAERMVVSSREEAMQAVLDGKADAAFTYLHQAQKFVNHNGHGMLTYTLLEEPTYDYCIACSSNVSHEMAGILTKCIYAMPNGTFEDIASQYTSYKVESMDFPTWIELYPIPTLIICSTVFLLLMLMLLLFYRHKMFNLEKKRSVQLQELADKAERANRFKSEFLANMSHDIRTPMNAIVGITNLMEHETDSSVKMQNYIQKIQLSSQYLLGLINDVLDMSKIEANEITFSKEAFLLSDQISQINDIIQEQAGQKQQLFTIEDHKIQHNYLVGDSVRLRQILLNLLTNAVKYTQVGGKVELAIEEVPNDATNCAKFHFTVTDNGSGIAPDVMEHIFEPFFRGEASVTNKIQGVGLGMAITKNIVDFMEGHIQIESTPGQGTSVVVTLEMTIDDQVNDEQAEILRDLTSGEKGVSVLQGKRFLCAEDNTLNAEILEAILNMRGAECTIYSDGEELLRAFENVKPGEYDAILMDIQMPKINGLEATRQIRKSPNSLGRDIPIVAMTANAFAEDIKQSIEAGMNAHISKPIDLGVLEKTMWKIFGGGRTALTRENEK